ncbi:MAG TPA: SH3 domain-containing protein [Spirochaetota bacterium]|nr:SH3 domain-containing protein [Spirochaetota bacterium]HPJ38773.1 SH3 domain-containing protein [Spirochaetota bacterium]HPQ54296.1 SH3 domain-containing protein [Spirochaetota bacterium]
MENTNEQKLREYISELEKTRTALEKLEQQRENISSETYNEYSAKHHQKIRELEAGIQSARAAIDIDHARSTQPAAETTVEQPAGSSVKKNAIIALAATGAFLVLLFTGAWFFHFSRIQETHNTAARTDSPAAATAAAEYVRVTEQQGLRMRSRPSVNAERICTIPYNSAVTVIDKEGPWESLYGMNNRWWKVRHLNHEGWVYAGFLGR